MSATELAALFSAALAASTLSSAGEAKAAGANIEAEAARARLAETTSARLPALRSVDTWSFISYPPRATFGSYKSS